jgi:hypothetical protein
MRWFLLLLLAGIAIQIVIACKRKSLPLPGPHKGETDTTDALFLTLSAEEIGKVAVLIIKGVERSQAIRAMPRYTRKQHKEYAAFYDQLREAMERAQKES